jgi:hypothetical protein
LVGLRARHGPWVGRVVKKRAFTSVGFLNGIPPT